MPNYDAGHYFLTALLPVRLDSILVDGQSHSRRHLIREALAILPAGERTAATRGKEGVESPFSRNTRTHFARFVVIDDVVFNGRVSEDALIAILDQVDPLAPQWVDRLSRPYLLFAADFDAASSADTELESYLVTLWETMPRELTSVLQHCVDFDKVGTAAAFFDYIKKCQIETTMPFNDYWSTPPPLTDFPFIPYAIGLGAALLATVAGIFWGKPWLLPAGCAALIAIVVLAFWQFIAKARTPFPKSPATAPSSDLPTILKALCLQRAFTRLAIEMQGADDQFVYQQFGAFLAANEPQTTGAPTQAPGIIGA